MKDSELLTLVINSADLQADLFAECNSNAAIAKLAQNPKNWELVSPSSPKGTWGYDWSELVGEYDDMCALVTLNPTIIETIMYFIISDMSWIAHHGGHSKSLFNS